LGKSNLYKLKLEWPPEVYIKKRETGEKTGEHAKNSHALRARDSLPSHYNTISSKRLEFAYIL
jgi:hypothetical protein